MGRHSITLDNFADFHGVVNGVEITSALPFEQYVPSDEIDVNLGRIARAARFGHLESLTFGRYSEQTSVTPGVDSLGEDGSATASFSASASTPPRTDSSLEQECDPMFHRSAGTIRLNLGHEDLDDVNLREPEPWAKYLDRAVSEGLRGAGNHHLLDAGIMRTIRMAAWSIPAALSSANTSPDEMLSTYGRMMVFYTGVHQLLSLLHYDARMEYSMTPGFSLDRLGLVQTYTRTRKFVDTK